ncbi:MAG: ABC transporter permease, partial [Candidatus Caldatribacteriota bacterium]
MKWYLTKRLLMLIPVLLGASILVFSLIHLAPGDPARTIAGEHASIQTIERIQEKYGLNKPLPTQYWIWLKQALQGDFGRSIVSNEFVSKEIWDRFPNTVELTVLAMFIAVAVGVFAGIVSASRQYSLLDYSVMGVALFGV